MGGVHPDATGDVQGRPESHCDPASIGVLNGQPALSNAIGGSWGPTRTLGPAITIFALTGEDRTIDVVVSP